MNKLVKIINGDCSDTNIVNQFPNKYFDMLFCSPPYNVGTNSNAFGGQKYITKESDFNKNYGKWLTNIIKLWLPKCKYVFVNIQEVSNNKIDLIEMMEELKQYYIDRMYWVKPSAIPQVVNNCLTNCVEWILIFSDEANGRAIKMNKNIGYVQNTIKINANSQNPFSDIHKALMNIELSDYVIRTFLNKNSKVVDIFGGLGTTAVSCIKRDCECVLIEKEQLYCEKAKERIEWEEQHIQMNLFDLMEGD